VSINTRIPATDSLPANNIYTDPSTIVVVSDLSITKTDGVASIIPGAKTTYSIRVVNNGPSDTYQYVASIVDIYPSSVNFAQWKCVPGAGAECYPGFSGPLNGIGPVQVYPTLPYLKFVDIYVTVGFWGSVTTAVTNRASVCFVAFLSSGLEGELMCFEPHLRLCY